MVDTRLVYLEPGKITIDRMILPELKPNGVIIETYQASICESERYFYQGITVRPEDEARGAQFTTMVFTDMLKSHQVQISMDGRGRVRDNIFIERLWWSLNYQYLYLWSLKNGA